MSFIEKEEIKNSLNTPVLANDITLKLISGILGWSKANRFYNKVKSYNIRQFIQAYKRKSKIKHIVSQEHLKRIPSTGSLLIIANHPTGIPDGILILDQVLKIRKDVKIIANQLTYKVDPLKPFTIPVDPYENGDSVRQNALQIRNIFDWLNEGHCIILFPAGDVANYNFKEKCVDEQFWHSTARKIILKHKGAILPWAIQGKNSQLFYQLGKFHPSIKSALLPREGLKVRRKPIYSHIGFPFKINGSETLLNDLETKIRLFCSLNLKEINRQSGTKNVNFPNFADVIGTTDSQKINAEVEKCTNIFAEKGSLKVILTTKKESPNIVNEIGRLREITFRSVGEGSGKAIDLDDHDNYFEHLVLWDKESMTIAGAYRLGNGDKLSKIAGYTSIIHEFYAPNEQNRKIINKSLILGRAFICKEYQQKPFSLFLLWQGIFGYLKKNETLEFIIGQTSIPNTFHEFSKKIMVDFLQKKHSHALNNQHFKAFNQFESLRIPLIDRFIENAEPSDFKRIDDLVQNIEPNGQKIPILFKRYIEQRAQVIGVNIDPDFQNSIDVLMIMEVERNPF